MSERELFEKWAVVAGYEIEACSDRHSGCDYQHADTNEAWDIWQAARALSACPDGSTEMDARRLKELERVCQLVLRGLQSGNVKSKPLMNFGDPNAESLKMESLEEIIDAALSRTGAVK